MAHSPTHVYFATYKPRDEDWGREWEFQAEHMITWASLVEKLQALGWTKQAHWVFAPPAGQDVAEAYSVLADSLLPHCEPEGTASRSWARMTQRKSTQTVNIG